MLINDFSQTLVINTVDDLVQNRIHMRTVIAHHRKADSRTSQLIVFSNFSYCNGEGVAHARHDPFNNTPFFLQRKNAMQCQPQPADSDNHLFQRLFYLIKHEGLDTIADLKFLETAKEYTAVLPGEYLAGIILKALQRSYFAFIDTFGIAQHARF
jgi:hypothetical protein